MEFAQSISVIVQTTLDGEAAANSLSPQKEIFLKSSNDNGKSFSSVVNLSNLTQTASKILDGCTRESCMRILVVKSCGRRG